MLTLIFFRKCLNRYSPQCWLIAPIFSLVQVQIGFRQLVPGLSSNDLITDYEQFYLFVLIFAFVGNYNTFKTTMIVLPATHLVFYHFQLQVEFEVHYSHKTGVLMTQDEVDATIRTRMNAMIGLVLFLLAHYWYLQKDLITFAIKNHMIARQQTQLREFFSEQGDPTIVADEEG